MAELSADGLQAHVARAVGEISKASSKKHAELRDSCKLTLDMLRRCPTLVQSPGHIFEAPDPAKDVKSEDAVAQVIRTMRLACTTKMAKLIAYALDSFQKLLSSGAVCGTDLREDGKTKARMVELVVESVISCLDVQDAAVNQQILRCLVTAVTMPGGDLHDTVLMNVINAVLRIHLGNNPANTESAKSAVKQIIMHVTNKMEAEYAAKLQKEPAGAAAAAPVAHKSVSIRESMRLSALSLSDNASTHSEEPAAVATAATAAAAAPQQQQQQQQEAAQEQSARDVVREIVEEVVSKSVGGEAAPEKEAAPDKAEAEEIPAALKTVLPADEAELLINDCLSIFRELCMIGAKDNPQADTVETETLLRNKVLALELLLEMISKGGQALRTEPRFVGVAIKNHLCTALLQAMLCPVPRVLKFSLSIFIELLQHWKEPLKREIGVFFSNIFLRLIESPTSTSQQKWMVLQLFSVVCKDSGQLADFYLNYDCDLESSNIFERMVNDLSKVAQGVSGSAPSEPKSGAGPTQQDMALRALGLECIVMILRSLVDWSKDIPSAAHSRQQQQPRPGESPASADAEGGQRTPNPGEEDGAEAEAAEQRAESELSLFQRQKKHKAAMEEVRAKFALAPRKGIDHAVKLKLIADSSAETVGAFLRDEAHNFDKKALGEYICGSKPYNKDVLRAFVERCSFPGMEVDEALREFVSLFQMGGEGQVVDRVMENFGARYFKDNHGDAHFPDPDAVYKLGYAIIMLATDLHNPMVKNKIKFNDWFLMVTGPKGLAMKFEEEYLRAVHDRIAARPLELKESSDAACVQDFLNPAHRAAIVDKSIRDISDSKRTFFHTTRTECVRPMFEAMWASAVVSFSILLESSDDEKVAQLCLDGFHCGIHISCAFYMETERVAFVSGLEKFTILNTTRDARPKNIAAIRTLVAVALEEGNHLQDSWCLVLNCVSNLERLRLIGPKDAQPAASQQQPAAAPQAQPAQNPRPSRDLQRQGVDPFPVTLDAELVAAIDKVYAEAQNLNDRAIVDFVNALCQVSATEVNSVSPRIFSLQKLADVSMRNMDRMRLVWSQIWEHLRHHIFLCGTHDHPAVATFAIGAMKQMALQLLEKEELSSYSFHKEFLKPLELVFIATPHGQIRELIVQALKQIISSRAATVQSGWSVVFTTLSMSVGKDAKILPPAFETLAEVAHAHYELVAQKFFVELVSCLVSFGRNTTHAEISKKALALLDECADHLVRGCPTMSPPPQGQLRKSQDASAPAVAAAEPAAQAPQQLSDCFEHLALWFPLLTGIASITAHPHIDVRSIALKSLFAIFNAHGEKFTAKFWELAARRVLFELFEPVGYSHAHRAFVSAVSDDSEWLATTCLNALQSLITLATRFFARITFLLPDILGLLQAFILQDNDVLAGVGSAALYQLVMENGPHLTREMWASITSIVRATCDADSALVRKLIDAATCPADAAAATAAAQASPSPAAAAAASPAAGVAVAASPSPVPPASVSPVSPVQGASSAVAAPSPSAQRRSTLVVQAPPLQAAPSASSASLQPASVASVSPALFSAAPLTGAENAILLMQQKCTVCGASEVERSLLRCPLCGESYYCSQHCQREDWARHGPACLARLTDAPAAPAQQCAYNYGQSAIAGVGMPARVVTGHFEITKQTIKTVEEIVYKQYAQLTTGDVRAILDAVGSNSDASAAAVDSAPTRALAARCGVADLARKATDTTAAFLRLLFYVYRCTAGDNAEEKQSLAEEKLIPASINLMYAVNKAQQDAPLGMLQLVLLVLNELHKIDDVQYRKHAPAMWPVLVILTLHPNLELRTAVLQHLGHSRTVLDVPSLIIMEPTNDGGCDQRVCSRYTSATYWMERWRGRRARQLAILCVLVTGDEDVDARVGGQKRGMWDRRRCRAIYAVPVEPRRSEAGTSRPNDEELLKYSLLLSIVLNLVSTFETLTHATTKGINKVHSGRRAASQPAGIINAMTANATQQDAGSSISPSSSAHSVHVLSTNNKTKPDNVAVLPSSPSASLQLDDASTAIRSTASTTRRTSSPSILSDRSSAGAPLLMASAMSSCATSDPRSSSPASSGAADDGTSACDDPHAGRGRSRSAGARHRSWSDSQHTDMLADTLSIPAVAPVDDPTDAMAAGPMDPTTVFKAARAEHVSTLIVSDINAFAASLQLSSSSASPSIASSSRKAALPGGLATTATACPSGTLSGDDDDDAHVMTSFTVIDDELSGAVWFEDTDSEAMDQQKLGDDVSSSGVITAAEKCMTSPEVNSSVVDDSLSMCHSMEKSIYVASLIDCGLDIVSLSAATSWLNALMLSPIVAPRQCRSSAAAEECMASPHKGSSVSVLDDSLDMFDSMDQSIYASSAAAEECMASPHKGSSVSVFDDSLDRFHSMDQSLFGEDDIVIVDVAPAETSSPASNSVAAASTVPETATATGAPKRGLRSKLSRGAKRAAKKVFGKLAKSLCC
eukprot:m51a1_g9133 putative brefeldin a-inhibited guanine nucleotide-exchange protein 1 (2465) ;mRNA; f:38911-50334